MRSTHCRICSLEWGHDEMTVHDVTGQPAPTTTGIGSFAEVPLRSELATEPATAAAVTAHVAAAAEAHGYQPEQLDWSTPEAIDVKPVYVAADRDAVVEAGYPLDTFPGAPPYL